MTNQVTDEYRRTSYEISQTIAPGWERWRSRFETVVAPVREWMVRELASPRGATVLELAAGAGDTGFEAVRALGGDARLISTDFSPAMLDVGRRRGAELGIKNVEFRVLDAEYLGLDTDSVDGVLCRFGYMLMADPAEALRETRRVLRPGGRLTLAVWGAAERNPFFTVIASTLVKGGQLPALREGVPTPFSMASPVQTKALLEAAGFRVVKVEEVPLEFQFRDVDDYLRFMADTAGPLAVALRKLPQPEGKAVAAGLENALGIFETGGEYKIPGIALVAAAS
ncbi:class I SAM-dependent methyltransferase [Actinopolymorpha alba]|uniref:class I SAM-dependent methyltransferase n=1 Tax=Actinopolymorpha alba TaxID=533267 RepID=UPI00035DA9F4|nr:class I SAM-dependent methyltransferase [Actinopolymorpha alba]